MDGHGWVVVDSSLSVSCDRKGQAAVKGRYFSGRKSSATASCSGTSGKKAQPLAIDREVACFLAAGRKPVAIKVERGGLQIVGVADDAQHRAASARDLAALDR